MTTPPRRQSQWTRIADEVDELDKGQLEFLDEVIAVMLEDETSTFMEALRFIMEHCR